MGDYDVLPTDGCSNTDRNGNEKIGKSNEYGPAPGTEASYWRNADARAGSKSCGFSTHGQCPLCAM
jgi:hypothetical protein